MINFQYFVNAHLQWRAKLSEDKNKDDFEIETIRCDNKCEIGKWFHGPGQAEYGRHPEFLIAKDAHADFHRTVADSLVKTGHTGSDEQFEILVKSLKRLSDALLTAEESEDKPRPPLHPALDPCKKAFKLAGAHIDARAPQLATAILTGLPCDTCSRIGNCDELKALFDRISKA